MAYSMDALQDGCYENSSVLINKFGIKDGTQLNDIEREITGGLIAKALYDISFTDVDFDFYKRLHKYVFEDIYEWAGQLRTVSTGKKGTSFCPPDEIEKRGLHLFDRLTQSGFLTRFNGEDFINEFTDLYCDLNYLHPFREGNGRIQRLFLNMLLLHTGRSIDFSKIDKDLLMIATIRSVNGDVFLLRDIFKEHIIIVNSNCQQA